MAELKKDYNKLRSATWLSWKPPNEGFKLNIDGSFRDGYGAVEGVIRDGRGTFICGFVGPIKATTSLDAETESLVTSILNLSKFWADITSIESDSKVLVDSLTGKVKPPWYIGC